MSLDVKVNENGTMYFVESIGVSQSDWDSVPKGKLITQYVLPTTLTLPPILRERIHNEIKYHERTCGCFFFNCIGFLCCFFPWICMSKNLWNIDRDPDLVRKEVVRLLNNTQIESDEYRISTFTGSFEVFESGRTVLKVHFHKLNVVEK